MALTAAVESLRRPAIFDFGGVVSFHPTGDQVAEAAQFCGLTVPEFLHAFWSNRIPYDAGELDEHAYWTRIVSDDKVDGMVQREIDFWMHFDDRVIAWIRILRANGVLAGMLSNLPPPIGRHLRTSTSLLSEFDQITLSYELHTVKPQPAIYRDMIHKLGVSAEQALFLDDRQDNVDGALALGLQAELYVSWRQFSTGAGERYPLIFNRH